METNPTQEAISSALNRIENLENKIDPKDENKDFYVVCICH